LRRFKQGPATLGMGASNQVALRLRRWVAAASAYWRRAETASVHQIGDYCVADTGEGEGQSGRAAAAATTARVALEAATLRNVLAVLNAAPCADEECVGRDTNLMEAGFDSLQVVDLLRQLQAAAPAGSAALTASALMEHPTPVGLVAHMMQTWQPRPAGNGGQQRATTSLAAAASFSSAAGAGEEDRGGVSGGGLRSGASLDIEIDDAHDGAAPGCFACRRRSKARHANNNERRIRDLTTDRGGKH
jgi:aryl carrier-like protein